MIDLSNNNGTHHDFHKAYFVGQRRLYVKVTQGNSFIDLTEKTLRVSAIAAGFKVGGYHFADDFDQSPEDQAAFFVSHLPKLDYRVHLRPCLDLEIGTADAELGVWATRFMAQVKKLTGRQCLIYSYASFLQLCKFQKAPGPLWLAAYGRNDGREYPFFIPGPWQGVAAHQFSSRATVAGIHGLCDISHIFNFDRFDMKPLILPWRA